jgi:steroid delta-isomerase-like uncharacterized protein
VAPVATAIEEDRPMAEPVPVAVITEAERQLVLRFVREVFEEGQVEALDRLVAADFRSHTWGQQGAGREDLRQAMERVATALTDRVFRVEDTIVEKDLVAVRLTASATQVGTFMGLPASGRRYTIGEIHLFRVRDERIVEHWQQYDVRALLQKLGAPAGTDAS